MVNGSIGVVIVDDQKDVVNMLSEFMEFSNPDVKVVGTGTNGKEAVQLYEDIKPDVIFLDINMPQYSGLYAIENIQKINPAAKIVVISNSLSYDTMKQLEEKSIPIIDKNEDFFKFQDYFNKL